MELKDTAELMLSNSYVDRFIAEYWQTKIRIERLHKMIVEARAGHLGFTPRCSVHILEEQERAMREYLTVLEVRAEIEEIDLHGNLV